MGDAVGRVVDDLVAQRLTPAGVHQDVVFHHLHRRLSGALGTVMTTFQRHFTRVINSKGATERNVHISLTHQQSGTVYRRTQLN